MTIQLNHVTKAYTQDIVLDDIIMKITDGEHLAVVGENGCGKSTLLKVIAGLETYQEGEVLISKNTKIAYLNQLFDEFEGSVLEYLLQAHQEIIQMQVQLNELEAAMADADMLQMESILKKYGNLQEHFEAGGGYQFITSVEQAVNGLQISHLLQCDYSQLSGGEKTRVNLARALLLKPDVLLLDEPTNHLDFSSIEIIEQILQEYSGSLLVVSHDRTFIQSLCDKVWMISEGTLKEYLKDRWMDAV